MICSVAPSLRIKSISDFFRNIGGGEGVCQSCLKLNLDWTETIIVENSFSPTFYVPGAIKQHFGSLNNKQQQTKLQTVKECLYSITEHQQALESSIVICSFWIGTSGNPFQFDLHVTESSTIDVYAVHKGSLWVEEAFQPDQTWHKTLYEQHRLSDKTWPFAMLIKAL